MTRVAILPVMTGKGDISYCAIVGDKRSEGKTVGQALDALTAQLPEEQVATLVVVQNLRPDRFFSAAQQRRLSTLMDRWRQARDKGENLTVDEQAELQTLVDAEVRASAARTSELSDDLGR